jgi:hypothetical protein
MRMAPARSPSLDAESGRVAPCGPPAGLVAASQVTGIVVEPLHGEGLLLLDAASGRMSPAPARSRKQGCATEVEGQTFALYADGGLLVLQWNDRRWPFAADAVHVRYGHDLSRKTTSFSVDERRVEYRAWWADDPRYDPLVPELDAEQDDLAWIAALKRDPGRMATLLKRWSAA